MFCRGSKVKECMPMVQHTLSVVQVTKIQTPNSRCEIIQSRKKSKKDDLHVVCGEFSQPLLTPKGERGH